MDDIGAAIVHYTQQLLPGASFDVVHGVIVAVIFVPCFILSLRHLGK